MSASGATVRSSEATQRDRSFEETASGPDVLAWIDWLEVGGAADTTLDQYERDLARLCKRFSEKTIQEITDADLLEVLRTFPKKSRRVRKASFSSFFKWARRTRRITENPCELLPDIKRTPQRYIETFTDVEVDDLAALPGDDGHLMTVLIEAGPRKAEARALQVRRVKLDTAELIIVGGKGGKDRVVMMTRRLRDELALWFQTDALDPQDYLWYSRPGGGRVQRSHAIGDGSFDRWWRRCLKAAGVEYRNPHVARHTFATRWLRRGGRLETLSEAMGHKSIQTTADLYAHLDTRDMAADIRVIEKASRR
jgi:integrase